MSADGWGEDPAPPSGGANPVNSVAKTGLGGITSSGFGVSAPAAAKSAFGGATGFGNPVSKAVPAAATTTGFPATTPSTGFPAATPGGFGQVTAPKSTFGNSAATTGFASAAPVNNGFPASAPKTAPGGTAVPAAGGFGNAAAVSNGFAAATPSNKGFPSTPASGGFPSAAPTGRFSSSASNRFGAAAPVTTPPATTGGFGASSAASGGFSNAPANKGFGSTASTGFPAAPANKGFGSTASKGFPTSTPAAPAANKGFVSTASTGFPSSTPAAPANKGFGSTASTGYPSSTPAAPANKGFVSTASTGFPSSTPAAPANKGFGSTASTVFPSSTPAAPAGKGFGSSEGFGAANSSSGAFPNKGFGSSTATSTGFPSSSAAATSGFGGAATGGFGGTATGGFGGTTSGGFGGTTSGGFGGSTSAPRGNDGTCFNCQQSGHKSSDCPEPRKPRGDGPMSCFNCGQDGHRSSDCTEPRKSQNCFNCGQEGHRSNECTEPRKSHACFNCGQEGHRVSECPEPPKPREDGAKPPSTFIPTEESPEELYHAGVEKGTMFDRFFDAAVTTMRGGLEGGETQAPVVFERFEQLCLGDKISQNVMQSGYTRPTPVQQHAMPAIKAGNDILACAQTGSGKTAAFLLPIMSKLLEDSDLSNAGELCCMPRCLIISPTRELSVQIYNEARKFSHGTILSCKVAYGGTHVGFQRSELAKGASIVVGTTGRLNQFIQEGTISLEKLRFFVLDEADRMLDMGFGDEINNINMHPSMPNKKVRQTLMFSATFPTEVQTQARQLLKEDYTMVTIDEIGAANKCITQELIMCEQHEKKDRLLELLSIDKTKYIVNDGSDIFKKKTLIFVSKKSFADTLGAIIATSGLPATTMHGDRLQNERAEAMRDFVSGRKAVMIATAVAERGLDIKGVDHVINYDLPDELDQYVHRIGRTGRVGNSGRATSFYISSKDNKLAPGLLKCMNAAGQVVPDWLKAEAEGGCASSGGGFGGGFGSAGGAAEEEAW